MTTATATATATEFKPLCPPLFPLGRGGVGGVRASRSRVPPFAGAEIGLIKQAHSPNRK
jgi:hypothetical protein